MYVARKPCLVPHVRRRPPSLNPRRQQLAGLDEICDQRAGLVWPQVPVVAKIGLGEDAECPSGQPEQFPLGVVLGGRRNGSTRAAGRVR